MEALSHRLSTWANAHPDIMNQFASFNEANIPWALYGSMVTGGRLSRDVDIVIPHAAFGAVVSYVRNWGIDATERREPHARVTCGDGLVLDAPATSIAYKSNNITVEIMASGVMQSVDESYSLGDDHHYDLSHTPYALAHRRRYMLGGTALYACNPFDVIAIKAILQRGAEQCKSDYWDVSHMLREQIIDAAYARTRGAEMGLDDRIFRWLGMASRGALRVAERGFSGPQRVSASRALVA